MCNRDWANHPTVDTEEELVKSRKKGTRWNELGTLMTGVRLRTLGVADIRRRWIERERGGNERCKGPQWDERKISLGTRRVGTVRDARHEGN